MSPQAPIVPVTPNSNEDSHSMTKNVPTHLARVVPTMALLALLLLVALGGSRALAATSYTGSGSFGSPGAGDGEFTHPDRIAVDRDNGNVYVVDAGNDRVQVFTVEGDSASYLTSITGLDDPYAIAIDQAASPISVYVSDAGNGRIVKLDSDGATTPTFTPDADFSVAAGAGPTRLGDFHADVEVDPLSGDLLVADTADDLVQRHDATGAFVDAFNGADSPAGVFTGLQDVAVDASGIYVVDAQGGAPADGASSRVERFDLAGDHQENVRPLQADGDGALAIDPNSTNLLVGDVRGFSARVHVMSGSTRVTTVSVPGTVQIRGLAVDGGTTERLYAAVDDPFCGGGCGHIGVQVLDSVALPDVTLNPVTDFDEFTATFAATVDPNGNAGTQVYLEYSTDQVTWEQAGFHEESTDPGLDGGDDPVALGDDVTGLANGTTYYVRAVVKSSAGEIISGVEQFTTPVVPAPEATIDPVTDVDGLTVHFTGTVDANGFDTDYRFEIAVDDETLEWHAFGKGDAGVGADAVPVTADRDLAAQTAYLARVVATNAGGTATSSETTFSTGTAAPTVRALPGSGRTTTSVRLNGVVQANGLTTTYRFEWGTSAAYGNSVPLTGSLSGGEGTEPVRYSRQITGLTPDTTYHYRIVATNSVGTVASADRVVRTPAADRAFEQVSAIDKNGNDVFDGGGVKVSSSGDLVAYESLGAFAGTPASGAGIAYLAKRSGSGWDSDSLLPPQLNDDQIMYGATRSISDDFSRSLTFSRVALAPGAVAGHTNVFIRDNDSGALDYMGGVPGSSWFGQVTGGYNTLVGGSSDFSSVVFWAPYAVAPGPEDGFFEASNNQIRRVSVLPDGTPVGARINGRTYELDQYQGAVSADGSSVFFEDATDNGGGPLYVREDGEETIPISVSHRAGDPDTPLPAAFGLANLDASVVAFQSKRPLTDESTADDSLKLYLLDRSSDQLIDLTADAEPGTDDGNLSPFLGMSEDGSTLYFFSSRALTPGAAFGEQNLYVWRAGEGLALVGTHEDIGLSPWPSDGWQYASSPSGRHFAFEAATSFRGANTRDPSCVLSGSSNPVTAPGYCRSVFVYDAESGALECASCPPDGSNPTGHSWVPYNGELDLRPSSVLDDGRVYFETLNKLVPEDGDGQVDVYEWRDGEPTLISVDTSTASEFSNASRDGHDVLFLTRDRLVGQDRDGLLDLYDARVGGGLAAQNPPPPTPPCTGDSCQGPHAGPPALRTPLQARRGNAAVPGTRATFSRPRLSSAQIARLARGRTVRIRVNVSRPGVVRAAVRARVGGRSRTIASSARRARRAGPVTLSLRLSRAGRRELAARGRLRATLSIRFTGAPQPRALRLSLTSNGR